MAIKIERQIVFTKVPLNGYFRYNDSFQIFPLEVKDLTTLQIQKHFLNVLEFTVDDSIKVTIPEQLKALEEMLHGTSISSDRVNQILRLLTAFSNHHFFQYNDIEGNFGFPITKDDEDESINQQISVWCLKYFHHPSWWKLFETGKFTDMSKLSEIPCVGMRRYFMDDPNLDRNIEVYVTLPCLIPIMLDAYYSFADEVRAYIDVAASYIVAANEIKKSRKTLSLISCFTSLETMVNLEYKNVKPEICKSCTQPIFSVRKKFREYLMKYVSATDASKKKFNKYYDFRSKLIHTGRQLKTEKLFPDISQVESINEWISEIEILQITKLSIIRWLIKNYEIVPPEETQSTVSVD
jgi:hypothetical protein